MGKVQEKKQQKRQALLDAAYDLFMERGQSKTSIDNIVNRAKVAKGTFYLYFSDKESISQALIWRISDRLFDQGLAHVKEQGEMPFLDQVLALADYLLEELSRDQVTLRLIRHSLRWPRVDELEENGQPPALLNKILEIMRACPELHGRDELELYQRLTAIVSMCVSVCYSCVIEHRPDTLEHMKPVLYDIIRKSL